MSQKIYVEEILHSPKLTYGQTPSIETTVRVFSDSSADLSTTLAFKYAMEWLAKHPVEKITELQRLTNVSVDPVKESDGKTYEVKFTHSKWHTKLTIFRMDTGGETAKRVFGVTKASGGTYDGSIQAPDFQGGVSFQNGEFQGIDVPVPGASFSITACYPWLFMTGDYANILTLYRGCVNSSDFLFYAAGEVLFLGAQIEMMPEVNEKGQQIFYWQVTFNFKASPNVVGLTNNNTLESINKRGWEAYWIYTVAKPDPTSQRVIQVPVAHYAVEVCLEVDFASLCIPDFRNQIQG